MGLLTDIFMALFSSGRPDDAKADDSDWRRDRIDPVKDEVDRQWEYERSKDP